MEAEFKKVSIFDIPITVCKTSEVESLISMAINSDVSPMKIAPLNLNVLRLTEENHEYKNILQKFEHCFADGWPFLYMAKKYKGVNLPGRVTGSDLTVLICRWAKKHNWKIGFIGSTEDVKRKLENILPASYNYSNFKHWLPTYANNQDLHDLSLSQEIKSNDIDILLVALGCYKQEKWIYQNMAESNVKVAISIGASLNFLALETKRSPVFLQKLGLEFLFRIIVDPRRLLWRYVQDFIFLCRVILWKKVR